MHNLKAAFWIAVASTVIVGCGASAPQMAFEREPTSVRVMSLRWVKQLAPPMPNLLVPEFAEEHDRFYPVETATAAFDTDKKRAFVGSSLGSLYCLDVTSGETIWRFDLEDGVGSQPLYIAEGARVFFGAENGKFYALNARSGRKLWVSDIGAEVREQAIFFDDTLYIKTARDSVLAIDPASGNQIWQYKQQMVEGFAAAGHSGMVLRGGLLLTGFSNGLIAAIDPSAGTAVWEQDLGGESRTSIADDEYIFWDVDATPVVFHDKVVAASLSGGLRGMELGNGTALWTRPDLKNITGLAGSDGIVYGAIADDGLVAVDVFTGKTVWQKKFDAGTLLDPVIEDDIMFISDSEYGLYVVSLISGELMQRLDPKKGFFARPGLHGGYLLILGNRGTLYSVSI